MTTRHLAVLAVACSLLGGCGGGGGGDAPAAPSTSDASSVPASAFASVDAFVAYLQQLVASSTETGEPLTLPDGAAPKSETTEPSA